MNTVKSEVYDVEKVIEVVQMLSHSQGFYGRLLEEINYIKEYEPEKFETFKEIIEEQEFTNPVDVVLFFEQ
jgi:hypothetical protein